MLLGMLIAVFIIMCIGIADYWFYDILLLRLAPPEYELKLFSIDKYQKKLTKIMKQISTFLCVIT